MNTKSDDKRVRTTILKKNAFYLWNNTSGEKCKAGRLSGIEEKKEQGQGKQERSTFCISAPM